MTFSYCFSTRNTTPEAFLPRTCNHIYLPKLPSSVFSGENSCPRREFLIFKPKISIFKPSLSVPRLGTNGFDRHLDTLSSFAEDEHGRENITSKDHHHHHHQENANTDDELPRMAQAFHISSSTASAISAVLTAAVLEFSGALLMVTHVTSTMQKGILMANVFQGKDILLFAGLISSVAAAGTWLQVASYYGFPVSTTHCIVVSMVGFGLAYGGTGAVFLNFTG